MAIWEPFDGCMMIGIGENNQAHIIDLILQGYDLYVDENMNVIGENGVHYAYARYKTQEEIDE